MDSRRIDSEKDRKEMEREEAVGEVFQFLCSNFDFLCVWGALLEYFRHIKRYNNNVANEYIYHLA